MRAPAKLVIAASAAAVGALLALAGTSLVTRIRAPSMSAAARGAALFDELGCAGCHGPGATGGVNNPRSKEREVPGFGGGMAMMYVETPEEIREWILDGRPARLTEPMAGRDALLQMPPYRDQVTEDELNDLLAWYRAVAWYGDELSTDALVGRKLARRLGCFGCHGASGQAGVRNPGSFKGYIPGWAGDDYAELVADDGELRAWILDGATTRFENNPVAKRFVDAQVIKMPAYRDVLGPGELESLMTYIRWVRQTRDDRE